MSRLRLLGLAAVAFASACGDKVPDASIRFSEPTAVAVFDGVTSKNAGVHPYVAVANAGRDDLTLLDAVDDRPVLSPILTRSLSVSVPSPRPTRLVASTLWDGLDAALPAAEPTADLLLVVSAGEAVLQLVKTWEADPVVVAGQAVDLSAVEPGAEIVALAAVPVPDGATLAPVAGRVRVLAALTGARLAVVEYARVANGAIEAGAVTVQALEAGGEPFQAVDLAVSPFDPAHVYVATPDPIAGVLGVAELDVRSAPGTWTARAIDARGPTRLVAAWRLKERKPNETGNPPGGFEDIAVDRVYAALDPAGCGRDQRVPCGIAVLDPVAGRILPDIPGVPVGGTGASVLMPYLAPIPIPGLPVALKISGPPARAPLGTVETYFQPPWMRLSAGTGARGTSAVMAVPSTNGRVYLVDLARWAVPNDQSMLRGASRTRVTAASSAGIDGSERRLGLWNREEETVAVESADLIPLPLVTPGFTPTETMTVRFQGELPGLAGVDGNPAETGRIGDPDGRTWLAMQVGDDVPAVGRQIYRSVRLYDPAFGLRVGDIALVFAPGVPGCPEATIVEARVGAILPPTAAYPGGAVALDPSLEDPIPEDDPATPEDEHAGWADWPACVTALGGGHQVRIAAFRAAEMVAAGSVTGYAGRPAVVYADELAASTPFTVAYEDEDALTCPLDPWPADPAAVPCDDACRTQCERLFLARKARRFYHLSDACDPTAMPVDPACTTWPDHAFPVANGPVVSFTVGYTPELDDDDEFVDPGGRLPVDDQKLWGTLRQMALTFDTQAGVNPASRASSTATSIAPIILPLGAATFDRSVYPGREADAYRFYVPYVYDYVLDFSPAQAVNLNVVIR
jgi:hypothetical protein